MIATCPARAEVRQGIYLVRGSDGNFYGPADLAELNRWAGEGRILADTAIVEQATQRQMFARDLPGLSHHFVGTGHTHQPAVGSYNPYQQHQQTPYPRGPYVPVAGEKKSKTTAALLAIFLGMLGIHRFYLGHTLLGVTMLAITTLGTYFCCIGWVVTGIWSIVDFIVILSGQMRDGYNQPLV